MRMLCMSLLDASPLDVGELEGLGIASLAHIQHQDFAVGIVDQLPCAEHVDTVLVAAVIVGHLLGPVPGGVGHGAARREPVEGTFGAEIIARDPEVVAVLEALGLDVLDQGLHFRLVLNGGQVGVHHPAGGRCLEPVHLVHRLDIIIVIADPDERCCVNVGGYAYRLLSNKKTNNVKRNQDCRRK